MNDGSSFLEWHRFTKLTEARKRFANTACIYVQTDRNGCPIRIGKASEGLEARYRGGTGYALKSISGIAIPDDDALREAATRRPSGGDFEHVRRPGLDPLF